MNYTTKKSRDFEIGFGLGRILFGFVAIFGIPGSITKCEWVSYYYALSFAAFGFASFIAMATLLYLQHQIRRGEIKDPAEEIVKWMRFNFFVLMSEAALFLLAYYGNDTCQRRAECVFPANFWMAHVLFPVLAKLSGLIFFHKDASDKKDE